MIEYSRFTTEVIIYDRKDAKRCIHISDVASCYSLVNGHKEIEK